MFIELRGHFLELAKTEARYVGEVMVGHVDAYPVGHQIEGASVGEGFVGVERVALLLSASLDGSQSSLVGAPGGAEVGVVLGDEVSSTGVQAQSEERGAQHVQDGTPAGNFVHRIQEDRLRADIVEISFPQWFWVDHQWSNGVEEGLEQYPQKLSEGCGEEKAFHGCWDIRVNTINTLVPVVLQVVLLEGCGVGDNKWEVGKVAVVNVVHCIVKEQVVRHFVNGQRQRMIRGTTNDIGDNEECEPRGVGLCTPDSTKDLKKDCGSAVVLGSRVVSKKLLNFRVSLQDNLSACSVWLLGVCPFEIGRLLVDSSHD